MSAGPVIAAVLVVAIAVLLVVQSRLEAAAEDALARRIEDREARARQSVRDIDRIQSSGGWR